MYGRTVCRHSANKYFVYLTCEYGVQSCYICEELSREGKATSGACMQCNRAGCKQHFHVTWSVSSIDLHWITVVTVIETGTKTAFFFAKPNRTETAVLCLCIDGSVLKWSSSGVLNVNSLQVVSPTRLAGGCYRWDQRWDRRRRRPCTPRVRTICD